MEHDRWDFLNVPNLEEENVVSVPCTPARLHTQCFRGTTRIGDAGRHKSVPLGHR